MPRHSAGGVVVLPDGRIVLVEQHGNSWTLPKGGVEEGEAPREAAVREIQEETGLTMLRYVRDLGSFERYSIGPDGRGEDTSRPPSRRTFFLFAALQELPEEFDDPSGEITRRRAVSVEEALSLMTHPKDREFLESVRGMLNI